ncbi:hypothetical protein HG535_0G00380 [Zygotorulaspora mrakii]|uniref:Uncharacterized protein n=1 Tax=Zygotorulaspora mrakii TaxID=42260 RepID=A0A7H9B6M3_ZYGMR|nr:uncharacterized protein HG535_0G00380 [Zygotorulaspora mrakii]QLG74153.1 hypothetical protein HG535_0G00380 [Zygotorulaspora mrakii]
MAIDQEAIKKRFSQIEDDINSMNKMIDDNLQIYETGKRNHESKSEPEPTTEAASAGEVAGVTIVSVSPKEFSEVTASVANTFIGNSLRKDSEGEIKEANRPSTGTLAKNDVSDPVATRETSEKPVTTETSTAQGPVEIVGKDSLNTALQQAAPETGDAILQTAARDPTPKVDKETVKPSVQPSESTQPTRIAERPPVKNITSKAVEHTTNTSEDFKDRSRASVEKASSLTSSQAETTTTQIFLPKNSQPDSSIGSPPSTPTTPSLRRSTNPFRVISVGNTSHDVSSRKSSKSSMENESNCVEPTSNTAKLERRLDYLTKKCSKLQKEIAYLHDMSNQTTLPIDDKRKLIEAIGKLQEYQDLKTKEKYEIGVQLSRQLRKDIDRGENGQFWVGTK